MFANAVRPPPPLSRADVRAADLAAVRMGLPVTTLMENAGRGLASVTDDVCIGYSRTRVAVLVHRGHNGGDGLVAARHLATAGRPVVVVTTCNVREARRDPAWALNQRAAASAGVRFESGATARALARALRTLDGSDVVVVDALLGTGLRGPVRGHVLRVLESLAHLRAPVVGADLPSGVDADTGDLLGPAPKCVATATFLAPKRGLLRGCGAERAGRVTVCDLGMPWWVLLPHCR